jgi:putative tryptophan/tyrosine transport system substrate-binding protein
VRRRDFTLLAAGLLFGPHVAWAQRANVPVVGVLHTRSQPDTMDAVDDVRWGLRETGWVDGQNVVVEQRWADADYDRLAALAADLVRQRASVILTTSLVAARAARAATSTIPIVFTIGDDPVKQGLVANLNRPGGNATGIAFMLVELSAKRLELLHELVPDATVIAALVNPTNPNLQSQTEGLEAAARDLGVQLLILNGSHDAALEAIFASLTQHGVRALFVGADPFFFSRRDLLITLAARHNVPAIYEWREFPEIGGLASYAPSRREASRQAAVYAGRILGGAQPSELPVQRPTKFELVLNNRTAKSLGLTIPPTLLARADAVIE